MLPIYFLRCNDLVHRRYICFQAHLKLEEGQEYVCGSSCVVSSLYPLSQLRTLLSICICLIHYNPAKQFRFIRRKHSISCYETLALSYWYHLNNMSRSAERPLVTEEIWYGSKRDSLALSSLFPRTHAALPKTVAKHARQGT